MPISSSLGAAFLVIVSCHGGPAGHFASFAKELTHDGYHVKIYATGPALQKLITEGIKVDEPFTIWPGEEKQMAEQIAKECSSASVLITDVGHSFDIDVQQAFKQFAPKVYRYAYYDNPERRVPGDYSIIAAKVMEMANGILFANMELVEAFAFPNKQKVGIGYYPLKQVEQIILRRSLEKNEQRADLFQKNKIIDRGQKVLVYFGGNNHDYFDEAFPAFLELLSQGMEQADLSHEVIMLQQHPGAKGENLDAKQVEVWLAKNGNNKQAPRIIISNYISDDAQVMADGAFYYQTTMAPQLLLVGIPTVQVGHEMYHDILTRHDLIPSVTNAKGLVDAILAIESDVKVDHNKILTGLGISEDWLKRLENAIHLKTR